MGVRSDDDDRTLGVIGRTPLHRHTTASGNRSRGADRDAARLVFDAMGTRFEIFVSAGSDSRAVAEEAIEIVERTHRELSRFEPGGAVWRINQSPGRRVPIDAELSGLLTRCLGYAEASGGAFSVVRRGSAFVPMARSLAMTADGAQAGLVEPGTELDLGGVAKGYAFDLVREAFEEFDFDGAFLHGGTSTILGLGSRIGDAAGTGWTVEIDPGDGSPPPPFCWVTGRCRCHRSTAIDPGMSSTHGRENPRAVLASRPASEHRPRKPTPGRPR